MDDETQSKVFGSSPLYFCIVNEGGGLCADERSVGHGGDDFDSQTVAKTTHQ